MKRSYPGKANTEQKPKYNEELYGEWDDEVRVFEQASLPITNIAGENDEDAHQRLIQIIQFEGFYAFCRARSQVLSPGVLPVSFGSITLRRALLRFSWTFRLRTLIRMLSYWLYNLGQLAIARRYPWLKGGVTILSGISQNEIITDSSDREFAQFCREGPIKILNNVSELVVQSSTKYRTESRIQYAKRPLSFLLRSSRVSGGDRLKLSFLLTRVILKVTLYQFKYPGCLLLQRDYLDLEIVRVLDRRKILKHVAFTNSNFNEQPLYMRARNRRRFAVHELYYSQNSYPFAYRDLPEVHPFPAFRHVKADCHWVWTEEYGQRLVAVDPCSTYKVCGPIMWRLDREGNNSSRTSDEFRVLIFDVTPATETVLKGLGLISPYYTAERMQRFVDEIHATVHRLAPEFDLKSVIQLKPKRKPEAGTHDNRYLEYLGNVASRYIEYLPPNSDIFSIVRSSDLVIGIPYTSAPLVAQHCGVRGAYFDPDSILIPAVRKNQPGLSFCSGPTELEDLINESMIDKKRTDDYSIKRRKE